MTNFTKKSQAKAKIAIGSTRIGMANKGHGTFGKTLDSFSNKERLAMTRQGVREKLQGTQELNRIKQGLPRPPDAKKTRLASTKKKKGSK